MFKVVIASLFVALSTAAPSIPPNPGYPSCNICGQGMKIGNATAIVTIPMNDPTTCAFFEQAGLLGYVKAEECPFAATFGKLYCSCVKGQATLSPASKPYTVVPKPTTKKPTKKPTKRPTKRPTKKPSLRPILKV